MGGIFDNFFDRIGTAVNGKSAGRYNSASQVNTGRFYNYHSSGTNNNYWLPNEGKDESQENKLRMNSVSSDMSDSLMPDARKNSVASEAISRKGSASE